MSREPGRTPRQVFGAMLRYYRERAGLTRTELARQVSKSVSLIQAIELGQRAATPVGGRHVMQEQVNRLIAAAQQPHIMVEVIPADTGAHEGVTGAFALADFTDVPSVGYQEGALRGQPVEEREDVASLDLTWAMLRSDALPRAASLALLEEAAKSWTSAR